MKPIYHFAFLLLIFVGFNSCKNKDGGVNIFSIDDDKKLGLQVSQQIAADPATYPILSEADYPQSYTYLRAIRDRILNSGKLNHKDDFVWDVKIIRSDTTLNAFCTPGGYIYVYSGIIKYLDTEDELAGVMGHEMAHADRRHSTDAMTEQYGIQTLVAIVLGKNQNALASLATNLLELKYSRKNEAEADEYSVIYLSATPYQCNGAAGFFEKLTASGSSGNTPEFLSTHPNPDNRIQAINDKAASIGCNTSPSGFNYNDFKNSLP
ncbi:MAG TPA: M48 family metalloprotease [Cytophagaceae bacterium]|nr:M48 family metalloprotease [Cytophagaceae bacterium]